MSLPNAYAQYSNNKVLTASPTELTLMLYEGAIKFCNMAIMGVEQKNIQKAHTNIIKVENIIDYLQKTLDMNISVSEEFDKIYIYLQGRLVQANLKKDKEILEEVCEHLRSMRDNWKEVMKVSREKGTV